MNTPSDGNSRRGSSVDSGIQLGSGAHSSGPVNVFFRLVSYTPDPMSHEDMQGSTPPAAPIVTPLNTPFTQSPVHSPMGHGMTDRLLYPSPPPIGTGVYYTTAGNPPPRFYPPTTGFVHELENEEINIKQRAMSADIHHSPPFGYVSGRPSKARAESLAFVSEQMLLSAMPDRYDD